MADKIMSKKIIYDESLDSEIQFKKFVATQHLKIMKYLMKMWNRWKWLTLLIWKYKIMKIL
ncbi:hypothetical protein METSMIF1_03332 [Methanobrevibacter smithii DSM 2374]|uniref:Uncharacterized protein n=1 Tax=Methanobrevibacter smithii DSM 2374 TaxID=521002 RepID=D2ZR49_METSM|nr:hypothetical protein METSMIF1_03332 [Methanobrevibacter smithii DSM 2374]